MIKKHNTVKKIIDAGIVAVLRSKSEVEAEKVSKACLEGGISNIEVTFSVPNADTVLKNLKNKFNGLITIGAGTVLDETSARIAILAGAEFIVSPNFNKNVALLCNTYGIPYIPGCMTINEITEAIKYGSDVIKLFPGEQFTANYIKSIKAPLPQVNIMITGGVNINNIAEWIRSGVIAVGVGGNLTSVKNGNYNEIIQMANEYVNQVKIGRGF